MLQPRGDLDARLDALALRVEESLTRVREWIGPSEASQVLGFASASSANEIDSAERAALDAKLAAAEQSAMLQAHRCAALEDRIAELEAALVGALDQRTQALAAADTARQQAARALDQLEQLEPGRGDRRGTDADNELTKALQAKLLEVERLSSELVDLRRSNEDWRGRARTSRRELERLTAEFEKASSQLAELRERDESSRKRLADLERTVAEQRRELDIAERRTKHLREHMTVRTSG